MKEEKDMYSVSALERAWAHMMKIGIVDSEPIQQLSKEIDRFVYLTTKVFDPVGGWYHACIAVIAASIVVSGDDREVSIEKARQYACAEVDKVDDTIVIRVDKPMVDAFCKTLDSDEATVLNAEEVEHAIRSGLLDVIDFKDGAREMAMLFDYMFDDKTDVSLELGNRIFDELSSELREIRVSAEDARKGLDIIAEARGHSGRGTLFTAISFSLVSIGYGRVGPDFWKKITDIVCEKLAEQGKYEAIRTLLNTGEPNLLLSICRHIHESSSFESADT